MEKSVKDRNDIDDLNERIKDIFYSCARKYHKKQFGEDDHEMRKHNVDFYKQYYIENKENNSDFKKILRECLVETRN